MYHYKVECNCGYQSKVVPFGEGSWGAGYFVPVLRKSDEELRFVRVVQHLNESEVDFNLRLDASITEIAMEQFGAEITVMSPLHLRDNVAITCPRCKQNNAFFEFTGM